MVRGLCHDNQELKDMYYPTSLTDIFFPEHGEAFLRTEEVAKSICDECSQKIVCLEYALLNKINYGVWGRTSAIERKEILDSRKELGLS